MTATAPLVRCPYCGRPLGPLDAIKVCGWCRWDFTADRERLGVIDLRPPFLPAAKTNEDLAHCGESGLPTWRRLLLHKRERIVECESWIAGVVTQETQRFLEIGGGLCYVSALVKERHPQAYVTATDISPRYLRQHAVPVGTFFEAQADTYAAVDAEALPFDDGQFDAVFSQMVLYRLPDPAVALREIARVLSPKGRYFGIESAAPWWPGPRARETQRLAAHAAPLGIVEVARTLLQWERHVRAAVPGIGGVALLRGRRVRGQLRHLLNAVRPLHAAIWIERARA